MALDPLKKACLECTLPICDDRSKECRYVQITRRRSKSNKEGRQLCEDILAILKEIRRKERKREYDRIRYLQRKGFGYKQPELRDPVRDIVEILLTLGETAAPAEPRR